MSGRPTSRLAPVARLLMVLVLGTLAAVPLRADPAATIDDDARQLLTRGRSLAADGRHADAIPFYDQALDMARVQLAPESPAIGHLLHELATVLRDAAHTDRAEREMARALEVLEPTLGPEHPDLLPLLVDLADLEASDGRPADAEPRYRRAAAILDRDTTADPTERVATLGRLARVVDELGRVDEAETLYRQALRAIDVDAPRSTRLAIAEATSLGHLAALLHRGERLDEAEALYRRAIHLRETALGPNHWLVAASRSDLALLLAHRGASAEALDLARRAAGLLAPYCDGLSASDAHGEHRSASLLCRDARTLVGRLESGELGPVPQPVDIAEPEPAPRTVVARPTIPRFRAQLASRESLLAAQQAAAALKSRLPGALGTLPSHVETVDLGTKGVWHRVQFGEFDDRTGAVDLCRLVSATGQECWVVEVPEAGR